MCIVYLFSASRKYEFEAYNRFEVLNEMVITYIYIYFYFILEGNIL
jgi:hypothetical protein